MAAPALQRVQVTESTPSGTDSLAEQLKQDIPSLWAQFQAAIQGDRKEYLQDLHRAAKAKTAEVNSRELIRLLARRNSYFRNGSLVTPSRIRPRLMLVEARTVWEDLFKICRAYWSMPYSKGYGRRLRFVVFDEEHEAVIGIIGLQSPPADLACRDKLFSYPKGRKLEYVNCMLDAYTIGAVPPYTHLLGGKLVASLVASADVRKAYWRAYANKRTLLDGKLLSQPLLAVTTASAFGRSSIYNRLKVGSRLIAEPIGWTKGFGTIHLESVYPLIEEWLDQKGLLVPAGFGNGPKVRWQNITTALHRLGLPAKCAEHGLKREVFLFRHVKNLEMVCSGAELPDPIQCEVEDLVAHWVERWAIPRSKRDQSWAHSLPIPAINAGLAELA